MINFKNIKIIFWNFIPFTKRYIRLFLSKNKYAQIDHFEVINEAELTDFIYLRIKVKNAYAIRIKGVLIPVLSDPFSAQIKLPVATKKTENIVVYGTRKKIKKSIQNQSIKQSISTPKMVLKNDGIKVNRQLSHNNLGFLNKINIETSQLENVLTNIKQHHIKESSFMLRSNTALKIKNTNISFKEIEYPPIK